jgi:ATP adenylyltransferase
MDRLRAPWRMAYLVGPGADECLFCRVWSSADDRENLVLCRRPRAFVMLNRYPYTPGHLMVAPVPHAASPDALDAADGAALAELLSQALKRLRDAVKPDGVNLGMNLGRAAGAGVVDHCHWHLVPRFAGDTNFASVVGEVRVIPEALLDTYDRLRPFFA